MAERPEAEIVTDSEIAALMRHIGQLQGTVEAQQQRQRDDHERLEHRIGSAMEAARVASAECAALDVRLTGKHGDNGVCGRVAQLERTVRTLRHVLTWVAGVAAIVAAAQVRQWLGL